MTDETAPKPRRRGPGRPFEAGNRANPSGRPRGSKNAALIALDAIGEAAAQDLLKTVVAKARVEGDMTAARIILDRVWPVRKGRPVTFTMPAIESAADTAKAVAAILEATASGQLTPDEASALTGIIEAMRRTLELTEIENRLTALEEARHDIEKPD